MRFLRTSFLTVGLLCSASSAAMAATLIYGAEVNAVLRERLGERPAALLPRVWAASR